MGDAAFVQLRGNGPPPPPAPPGGQRQQAGQPMQQFPPPHPPPPPRDSLPVELRLNRPLIDISDISQDFLSEADMRAKCTEFLPIRFEKVLDQRPHDDDDDERMRSNWERAIRTQVQGLSRRDIEREIRRLDATTHGVMQKKATLGPALLRQLDKTMSELSHGDHDPANFQWTLAQADHQLKQVDRLTAMQRDRIPLGKKMSNSHKKRSSSSATSKKKYWERVSLTAYFKRSPRPHVNIPFLYSARKKSLAMTQGGMPMGPPGDPRHAMQGGQGGPVRMPQGGPARMPHGGPPPVGRGPGGPPPPPFRQGTGPGRPPVGVTAIPNGKKKPKVYHEAQSVSGSESSGSSDDESFFSEPTHTTATSESRSSRSSKYEKRGRHRSRSRHQSRSRGRNNGRSRENSRHYGIDSPRRHTRHEQHYILDSGLRLPPVPAPSPILQTASSSDIERIKEGAYFAGRADEKFKKPSPPPLIQTTSASDIERIKEDAYLAGRTDERADYRFAADEFALEARPRFAPPPRVIQQPRHLVRTIDPRDLPRETAHDIRRPSYTDEDLAPFERLSIDSRDWEYERDLRRFDAAPRRREFEYNGRFDLVDDEDNFVRVVKETREAPYLGARRRTSEYMRRPEVPYAPDLERDSAANPFAPRFRRESSYERRFRV
ncbi:hypothetical protein BJ170DRAFT_101327 [Xylariales sp. AK1849]|nr:hypothetical protein BJ170DRAFT_101327 [Xylariales sp. AK1849]